MKVLILFAFTIANAGTSKSSCVIKEDDIDFAKEGALYDRYIDFADEEDKVVKADLQSDEDFGLIEKRLKNLTNTEYWLYTRENPDTAQILIFNDDASIQKSNFDPNKHTVFLVHGFMGTAKSPPNPTSRAAYLKKLDVNIISVDWRRLSHASYVVATYGVPEIGQNVGEFINWLHDSFGLEYDNVHLVGFSLGAHVVGNAGRTTGGKVVRVTGLDPAGPLWNFNKNKLAPTDGVYVEAIHTSSLGHKSPIARVDFYPNGGTQQPGCLSTGCNHLRSTELFAATINDDRLIGKRCEKSYQLEGNECNGVELIMGNDMLNKTGDPGSYRLNTGAEYPFLLETGSYG